MRSRMGADRTAGHRRVGPTRDGCHGNDDDPAGAHRRQWIVCRGRRAMKITVTLLANAVALLLLTAPLAEAQQTRRIPRVGVLGGQSPEGSPPILALRQGLSELGYVEGETIALEWRWAQGKNEGFAGLAAELVRLKVDIIVAGTDPAVQAAQRATRTIPIVMAFATDPVSLGFVTSLARPGGNITGLSFQSSAEIAGKRLQLLREIVPTVARVSILGDPREPDTQDGLREMEAASRGLSLRLQPVEVRSGGELDRAFAAIAREHAGGIVILRGPVLFAYRARIAQLAAKHRPSDNGLAAGADGGRRPHVLRGESVRSGAASCDVRRQDPQVHQACRPPGRAA